MKMKMDEYGKVLTQLTPPLLDVLRGVVEWIDKVLTKETRRDFEFREGQMQKESGFYDAVSRRLSSQEKFEEIFAIENSLKGDWGVFLIKGDGILQLNYENYSGFKAAMNKLLLKQPYGYKRSLERPSIKLEILIEQKDDDVYVKFGDERPIPIAKIGDNQGDLLLLLGQPFGVARTIESVAEHLGIKTGVTDTLKNAMREIQRKLAKRQKRKVMRLGFDEDMVWLEVK